MTAIGHTGKQQLDRDFQWQLLELLANYYPHSHVGRWAELDENEGKVKVNLIYLMEHGLIESDAKVEKRFGGGFAYGCSRLTKKGMDFIAEDGGLSAIFGVQIIKLHDDTVRELIIQRIMADDSQPAYKHKLLDALRELPAESIKHLTMKLLDLGLDKGPDAMRWLSNYLLPGTP